MPLESASMFPPTNTEPIPEGFWRCINGALHAHNERCITEKCLIDILQKKQQKIQQPIVAVIDNELALEAFGTNIIVQEDKFRTGYECKVCDGACHGTSTCPRCRGSKTIMASALDDKDSPGLVPCKACLIMSVTGNMVPCGFIPCATCKGKGASLVVPEESMRRPSSGKVVSTGAKVETIKCGDRILYSNHAGYAMNFKQKTVFRIMHEHEILSLMHGVGDLGKKLD